MNDKDEALRIALEALTVLLDEWTPARQAQLKGMEAVTAIKSALSGEAQTRSVDKDEPVALAWAEGYRMGIADERTSEANIGIAGFNAKVEPARENPYANTPPQQKAKDEPVAWVYPEFWQHLENLNCGTAYRLTGIGRQPLYTTQPPVAEPHKRTWQSLTDEDWRDVANETDRIIWPEVRQAIEAKLKEKNYD
jgi:hypothetical protein